MAGNKKLDEVIKAWEICDETVTANCPDCPYDIDCENVPREDLRADALQYLKEYSKNKDGLESKRQILDFKIKMFEEQTELVQQQGKELEERCRAEIARYLEAVKNCEKAENKYYMLCELNRQPNNPLTWDELKTMVGKPVWVVGEHGCILDQKSWVLIRLDNENEDLIICVATNNGHYEFAIGKEDYGKDWKAYRKERG